MCGVSGPMGTQCVKYLGLLELNLWGVLSCGSSMCGLSSLWESLMCGESLPVEVQCV